MYFSMPTQPLPMSQARNRAVPLAGLEPLCFGLPSPAMPLDVYLRRLSGQRLHTHIGTRCTVGELKSRVANDHRIRRSCQRIVSPDGRLLTDGTRVVETAEWLVITDLIDSAVRMHVDIELELVESAYECAVCQADTRLRLCAQCRSTRYCSLACQYADWASHKRSCRPPDY